MKVQDLIENSDEHMYPQELWNELVQILRGAEQDLQNQQQDSTTYSIGGNFHQASSGSVQLQKNYVSHFHYGGSMTWNYALKIGTNVQGRKALEHAQSVYKQLVQTVRDAVAFAGNVKIQADHNDIMHINVDDRQFTIKYDYASNFCTVAIRVAK